jgi:hypothetical protein
MEAAIMLGRGPFGTDLEEQITAVIFTLRDDRELVARVMELWDVVRSRPCIDDQAREAVAQMVREIVAALGLDPNTWPHHLEVSYLAFERIFGEAIRDGYQDRQS